jgi:ADA HAT complex component 1
LQYNISFISERLYNVSHGMFRLLPWSSGIGGNKVMAEDVKMLVAPTQRKSPVLDSPSLHKLKRKLADSHDSITVLDGPPPTKRRLGNPDQVPPTDIDVNGDRTPASESATNGTVMPAPSAPSEQTPKAQSRTEKSIAAHPDSHHADNRATAPPKMDVERLRQALDAQLSLEVLLKHNELRLIDQEIAKCQIALEQLRRCAEIPYPGSSVSGISQSVSSGTGFAVAPSAGGRPPVSPAPWGVTDGPYSRHYAKWLLPDPQFDAGESDPAASLSGYTSLDGRTTRGSLGDGGYVAGKSRSQRGSLNTKLQALPSGYPPPKDKAGPMIIKRKSDGQLVKLVCLDCRRFDFSSTQGFINHCRIAHGRTFASHDAAAAASGEPVEVDETGMVVGGNTDSASSGTPGYVHPLIRSAHAIESTSKDSNRQQLSVEMPALQSTRSRESPQKKPVAPDPSFKSSPDTPHLSSLLERRGLGLDLGDLVGDAKTTVDLNAFSSEEESDEETTETASESRPQLSVQGSRLPARTTMSQAASQRPNSRKGFEKARSGQNPRHTETTPARRPSYTSPYAPPVGTLQLDGSQDADMVDSAENLSPHTVESNQAPSLVSDDDEYEAHSDSESPTPSEAGDDEQDFNHIEVEDDEGTATSTTTETKTDHELASPAKSHAPSLSKSLRRTKKKDGVLGGPIVSLNRGGKDGRRVSFVSPSTSPSRTKKDAGKKQHR